MIATRLFELVRPARKVVRPGGSQHGPCVACVHASGRVMLSSSETMLTAWQDGLNEWVRAGQERAKYAAWDITSITSRQLMTRCSGMTSLLRLTIWVS